MGAAKQVSRHGALWTATLCLFAASATAGEAIDYARDIKPILKARCYACHGALKQEAGLRLDTGRLILQGGDTGPAAVPGHADQSLLLQRVSATDTAERMPAEGQPLTAEQIAAVRSWISQGAPSPDDEPPEQDPRQHWAFRPPARPAVARVAGSGAPPGPIDAFIQQRLLDHGLTPQQPARKDVLLRRVYLDLIGLPPTREELLEFLADESPEAYARVVERLLDSPQYGERWGRHWMDIWRYSDWYGRRHVPDVWNSAPQIWRWRDWIVRSLNEDHGYDRMLREMLAADETSPEDADAAVATGYLIRNWYALNPNDWMRSTVEHTGKAFLGLTLQCAHCHDHKYDPITQEDYFRFRAFFEPIYVRQDRVVGQPDPGPFQDYEYSALRKIQRLGAVRVFDRSPEAPTWFYTGGDERNRVPERGPVPPGLPAFLAESPPRIEPIELPPRAWYPGLNPAIQQTALAEARQRVAQLEREIVAEVAGNAAAQPGQAKLIAARTELASIEATIAADRARYEHVPDADIAALARAASRLQREAALRKAEADVAASEQALVTAEGKPANDAERDKQLAAATNQLEVARKQCQQASAALADESQADRYTPLSPIYPRISTGRRRALANWITSRDNPLTARVAVNHIWARHFHAPLVASVYDFGRNGTPPTHPELLDWLAVEFMDSGWSMKHLHRLIVTSDVFCRSSGGQAVQVDTENKFLARMNAGRMEAEVVRDSLLSCAGQLDLQVGGEELENGEALTTFRRSLYYSVYPEQGGKSPLGELFDAPDPLDCYRRTQSIVPQQALALTNSDLVHQISTRMVRDWERSSAGDTAADLRSEAGSQQQAWERFTTAMFQQILSRLPTEAEWQACRRALDDYHRLLTNTGGEDPQVIDRKVKESLVRVLFNHNDFVAIR